MKNSYVLVVDDEGIIRNLFIDLLAEQGIKVIATPNGREAVEKVKQIEFSLAFIDVHMPVMNGVETLKEIKKIKPEVTVVMMDSFPNSLIKEATKEGAMSCIHKPFEIKEVLKIVEEVIK